jgi:hypothetical protein
MDRRASVGVVVAGIAGIAGDAVAQGPRWGQDAEKEFGLGR